jgi:hypothetical protein
VGAGQKLQAVHAGQVQVGEVEARIRGRVHDLDAVQQHQQVVCLGASDPDLGERAQAASGIDRKARQVPERIGAHVDAVVEVAHDHGQGGTLRGQAVGGNHQVLDVRGRLLRAVGRCGLGAARTADEQHERNDQ